MSNSLAHPQQLVSVEDYLEGERLSEVRHEYVGGHVYAMAGASDDHNRIAGKQELTVLRRGRSQAWQAEVIEGLSGVLKLPEIRVEIPLARIYERTAISRSKR